MKRKKVLLFRPSLGEGGADRVTATLLRRLDRTKFDPSLALLRVEGPFLQDVPSDVAVHPVSARRLALSAPNLADVIRRIEPDIVFSTASAANMVAVMAHAIARSKAKLVLSERSTLYRDMPNALKQRVEVALKRVVYQRAHVITAVSSGLANQLITRLRLPIDKVHVVYNPMFEDDLPARAAEHVDHPWFAAGQPPVLLACSRLIPLKDYPALLDAFVRIRAVRHARFFVLGDGPLKAELVERAKQLGVADDVCFYGFDKNPMKYMARASMLLHASHVEGLPGSLIQTMACGTPVVSTDCDFGPREVISRPNVDGFLVRVGDVAALADHALRLLHDEPLRRSIGEAARVSASRFTTSASLARYEAALEA